MSIWTRIAAAVTALVARGESLLAFFERSATPPERSVAFTIAVVSLGAKMAKADGQVRPIEVAAFREVFQIAPQDEPAAARVFNLARQDIAGFEVYARRIARMFVGEPRVLDDILEGLFHIATVDGGLHEEEDWFLDRVAQAFGTAPLALACMKARYTRGEACDPWQVLGVSPGADLGEVRARWKSLVRTGHPDQMIARGLPVESVRLATARLTAINRAWDEISARAAERAAVG